ncbi:MAG TPA: metallophosphoesterase [Gammaproteobacteria bacterium]|nr:metallophosphoesterase [Gammaproteobacteria bacterium]
MRELPGDDELRRLLAGRVDPAHIDARLALEARGPQPALGTRLFLEPLERWLFSDTVLRGALTLLGLYHAGRRNALDIRVTSNRLALRGLPPAFRGYKLLQLSDLHLDMNEELPAAIMRRVAGIEYDAAVLTGDYRYATYGPSEPSLRALARVRAALAGPVYAVLGNHDSLRIVPLLEDMGMRVLLNESTVLERSGERLFLAGVDDPHFFRLADPRRARAGIPATAPSILLAHSPEIYVEAAAAGFDALLCGHTHGGQIRLPGEIPLLYNARCPRRICAGGWTHDGLAGYTSVGAGASLIDVRLNCPPEVVLHTLAPA